MADFNSISEPAIAALVSGFYGKARRDPMIGPLGAVRFFIEFLTKPS
jgi:truncated hemoglobin YjbI